MTEKEKIKLEQVLANNPAHPVIVAGTQNAGEENSVVLAADMNERDLHMPSFWQKITDLKARNNTVRLVIEGLDALAPAEQEKFVPLIKDRRAGNYKLPANVQIVIPVAEKGRVCPKIQSLSLVWEVRE